MALELPPEIDPLPHTQTDTLTTTPVELSVGARVFPRLIEVYTTSSAVQFAAFSGSVAAGDWSPVPPAVYFPVWEHVDGRRAGSMLALRTSAGSATVTLRCS